MLFLFGQNNQRCFFQKKKSLPLCPLSIKSFFFRLFSRYFPARSTLFLYFREHPHLADQTQTTAGAACGGTRECNECASIVCATSMTAARHAVSTPEIYNLRKIWFWGKNVFVSFFMTQLLRLFVLYFPFFPPSPACAKRQYIFFEFTSLHTCTLFTSCLWSYPSLQGCLERSSEYTSTKLIIEIKHA